LETIQNNTKTASLSIAGNAGKNAAFKSSIMWTYRVVEIRNTISQIQSQQTTFLTLSL